MSKKVILAVFKRDFLSYFSSPTGYVFITLFIFMSAIAAFWPERFFMDNLANLNHLNALMPFLLLFFVPAITMNSWAGERSQGTDELLLTLPATDTEVVLGKYFSVLGIYTVSLAFSLSHILVLYSLGNPDLGVMFGTYAGYWLMGAALLAIGLVASILTTNATVGFIYGASISSIFVFAEHIGRFFFPRRLAGLMEWLSIPGQFESFGQGRFLFSALFYFVGLTAVFLFINIVLVNKRHWIVKGRLAMSLHQSVRSASVLITAIAVSSVFYSIGWGGDLTAERLHTLSDQTRTVLAEINKNKKPVLIEAFISPRVPKQYVETRENLIAALKEFDRIGGSGVQLIIHDIEKYTDIARTAFDNFGIRAQPVPGDNGGPEEMYMAVAFRCGAEEDIITLDRGLSIEYELTRSVRVVAKSNRKVIGIVETAAKINGGFDMKTFQRQPQWSVIAELKRQYTVRSVNADSPIPTDLDALVVAMPSSLTQKQINHLQSWILAGGPTLLLDDPLPMFNMQLAASQPRPSAGGNPMMPQRNPKQEPKGNLGPMLRKLGIAWNNDQVVFQQYNPHPEFQHLGPEFLFVSPASGNLKSFNAENQITSDLQEALFLFGGSLSKEPTTKNTFIPLIKTNSTSGRNPFSKLTSRSFFGMGLNPNCPHYVDTEEYTLAAQVTGETLAEMPEPKGTKKDDKKNGKKPESKKFSKINTIFIADLDMISEQFFQIRRQGFKGLNFDNVTFVLNCVDALCGEEAFMDIRKKRVKHRTLAKLEALTNDFAEELLKQEKAAEEDAEAALKMAQKALDSKIAAISNESNLDQTSKRIKIEQVTDREKRKFNIAKVKIDENKKAQINRRKADKEIAVRSIQSGIRIYAVLLPPLPALFLALLIFFWRRSRENLGVSENRMV
jgi:ABC-2 type transport system permease protein